MQWSLLVACRNGPEATVDNIEKALTIGNSEALGTLVDRPDSDEHWLELVEGTTGPN